ncbi:MULTISPECIES: hypothetical protein [unclassified Bradyrhizobium]
MFQFVSGLISATPRKRASPHGKVALSPLTIAWRSRVRNPQKPPCHHDFDFSGLRQPTPAFAKRPGGAGGPPPGPPPSDDGSSDSSSTDPTSSNSTDGSTAKILEQVLQALQQSQSSRSSYGANGSATGSSNSSDFSALLIDARS